MCWLYELSILFTVTSVACINPIKFFATFLYCIIRWNPFFNNFLRLNRVLHGSPPVTHWTKRRLTKPHFVQLRLWCLLVHFRFQNFCTSFYTFRFFKGSFENKKAPVHKKHAGDFLITSFGLHYQKAIYLSFWNHQNLALFWYSELEINRQFLKTMSIQLKHHIARKIPSTYDKMLAFLY